MLVDLLALADLHAQKRYYTMAADLKSLNTLLKATSKAQVEKCLSLTFTTRSETSDDCTNALCSILSLDDKAEGESLRQALLECIEVPLSSGNIESLAVFFQTYAAEVDPKLQGLVGKIIDSRLATWKEAAALTRPSLPRLLDHNWSLHMQQASQSVSSMNLPTVRMQLKLEAQPSQSAVMPSVSNVEFELSSEALGTMLDGLGKIKEQLALMGK